ncbi:MAG: serine hydrolase [Rhodospirillales bacterium]|nr:serine hydrolase [Rhodospirillales bacterium]
MSSGVKWNEDYSDPNADVARAGAKILEPGVNPIVSYMKALPRANEPGTKFHYNTGETDLASILVANAVGRSLSQYASEKLWQAYGMERDATWLVDVAGHERGGERLVVAAPHARSRLRSCKVATDAQDLVDAAARPAISAPSSEDNRKDMITVRTSGTATKTMAVRISPPAIGPPLNSSAPCKTSAA